MESEELMTNIVSEETRQQIVDLLVWRSGYSKVEILAVKPIDYQGRWASQVKDGETYEVFYRFERPLPDHQRELGRRRAKVGRSLKMSHLMGELDDWEDGPVTVLQDPVLDDGLGDLEAIPF